ncbi:DNA cytosine methyltransferase [Bosea vestrisii]|uniref:DNA cytosine methyltransferase n=1 Tax=Bosea vestrisii TaxID=151416 RepID=A0ABW0HAF4_9HYPH
MTAWYNEIDSYAADWLENLIREGEIAPGVVDRRSIVDVRPSDLAGFTQCHFFAGVGVWSLALRSAGWPDDRSVWTGSCPCQPFSAAGKGDGFADERHLWPLWHYLIEQCGPENVFGEQVASKDGLAWLDLVQTDLEGACYALWPVDLCAAGVGSPHIRQRLWLVAVALQHAARNGRFERWSQSGGRGAAGGRLLGELGHHHHQGLEGLRGGHRAEIGRDGTLRPVAASGQLGGMAFSETGGRSGWARYQKGQRPSQLGSCDDRGVMRLADADGRNASSEGLQRGRQHGQQQENGCACALANTSDRQLQESFWRSQGRNGHGPDRTNDDRSSWGGSPTNGFWRDADWLHCRDGKWRPVEPGTFPLAHGITNRVGRLRAYGNAIVRQAAEAIIRTYLEAEAAGFESLRELDLVAADLTIQDLLG